MQINNVIEQLFKIDDRKAFVQYLNNNISQIETTFYRSEFDTLYDIRFKLEDLIYHIEENNLTSLDEEYRNVKAFIIILGDFYDRFCLKGPIGLILQYIPKCSIRIRLEASKKYLSFNNIGDYCFRFDEIMSSLNDVYINSDIGYSVRISVMNFFLRAKTDLNDKYYNELEKLGSLFENKKEEYPLLNHKSIQELISNGIKCGLGELQAFTKELQKDIFDSNILEIKVHADVDNNQPKNLHPKKKRKILIANNIQENKLISEEGSEYSKAFIQQPNKGLKAIQALAKRFGENNNENHNKLERGTAIIKDEGLLFQYIMSYSNMHKNKLLSSFDKIDWKKLNNKSINCIDWGCGQAFATVVLNDYLIQNKININIELSILIEPSLLALKRGLVHARYLSLINNAYPINKDLESILKEDIFIENKQNTVHLLSNILDVPKFDISSLCEKISKSLSSQNLFICISPNIDASRNQRIESFYKWWENNHNISLISEREGNIGKHTRFERVFWVYS